MHSLLWQLPKYFNLKKWTQDLLLLLLLHFFYSIYLSLPLKAEVEEMFVSKAMTKKMEY